MVKLLKREKNKAASGSWQKGMDRMLHKAKEASRQAAALSPAVKDKVLLEVESRIRKASRRIIRENAKDVELARQMNLSSAMIDRLTLTHERVEQMAEGVRSVAKLENPVGKVLQKWKRPNGLQISKVSVPLGVILIIYESRPNVTAECASLCLKSGNAVVLRGGKEAFYSNRILASFFAEALKKCGISPACVSFVSTTDREAVDYLLKQEESINLVIPRGGESLIRKVIETSRIPVIKHYQGVCHVYVDEAADIGKAVSIAYNAKMQRTGVCNAMETLLVHRDIAGRFLPLLAEKLKRDGCEVRGDKVTRRWVDWAKPAGPGDYGKEFLDKILAVKVVGDVSEAIKHIQDYGSGHTDAIVTQNKKTAKAFAENVDSSSVMINASTRFADGFEYGFGAEIGISTDKIHARGPMGLDGLTTYKYVVEGNGQIRG